MRNKFLIIIILILSVTLVGGCVESKQNYQDKMTKILSDTDRELDDLTKESVEKEKSKEDFNKDQQKILEDTLDKTDSITPPDDFFVGHADLVQFLEFTIEAKELEVKADKESEEDDSGEPQISPDRTESLKMTMAANRSLGRAARALPFLEFDLLETFGQLVGGPGVGAPQTPSQPPRRITPPSN